MKAPAHLTTFMERWGIFRTFLANDGETWLVSTLALPQHPVCACGTNAAYAEAICSALNLVAAAMRPAAKPELKPRLRCEDCDALTAITIHGLCPECDRLAHPAPATTPPLGAEAPSDAALSELASPGMDTK